MLYMGGNSGGRRGGPRTRQSAQKNGQRSPRGSAGAARADSDPTKAPNLSRSEDELCHVAQPGLAWGLLPPTSYKGCRYRLSERSYGSSARAPHRIIHLRLPINWAEVLSATLQRRSNGAYWRYKRGVARLRSDRGAPSSTGEPAAKNMLPPSQRSCDRG